MTSNERLEWEKFIIGRTQQKTEPSTMNKTEAAYQHRLEMLKRAGEILDYKFEPFKLILAPKTTYTPDFLVILKNEIQVHEVKGFWRDDARVKIKIAAEMFYWMRFFAVQKANKKLSSKWTFEEFKLK